MASSCTSSRIVPSSRFHHYVPAVTSLHIPKERWNGTGLNHYEFSGDNDGSMVPPAKPDFGMAFLITGHGKANYQLNGPKWTPVTLQPNTGHLVRPGSTLNWQWRAKNLGDPKPQAVNIILDMDLIHKTALQALNRDFASIELPNALAIHDDLLRYISLELLKEAKNKSPFGKMYAETLTQLMVVHLLTKYVSIHIDTKMAGSGLPRHLQNRIREYIYENLAGDISIDTLSNLVGLSSYHFVRMFNCSFGIPPHQYVVIRRIEKAKQLLKCSEVSMTQIALEVGYQSHSHFTNVFRKMTGCTPSRFRKNHG